MIGALKLLNILGYPVRKANRIFQELITQKNLLACHEQLKWDIFNYQYSENEFYKTFVGNKPKRWEDIPIIKKENLQGDYNSKIPASYRTKRNYLGHTSGSSGKPMYYVKDRYSHALTWLNIEYLYALTGVSMKSLEARVFGIPANGFSFYKEKVKDFILRRERLYVNDLGKDVFNIWLLKFKRRSFKYIYGYSNSILAFCQFLQNKDVVLKEYSPSLVACVLTSESILPQDEKFIESNLGVKVYNEYGASEVGIIGFKIQDSWRVVDELLHIEVVDQKGRLLADGEIGRFLITSLHNKCTPLIRYELGDVGSIEHTDGRTYITHLQGRLNDFGVLPSGKKIPPATFNYAIKEALAYRGKILEHQVVQVSVDHFVVKLVCYQPLDSKDHERLKIQFIRSLGEGVEVSIEEVDKIERSSSGKFSAFHSLIEPS